MKLLYKISVFFIIYALLAIPDNRSSMHIPTKSGLKSNSKWWGNFAQNLEEYRTSNEQNQIYAYNKNREGLTKKLDIFLLGLTNFNNPILDSISYHLTNLSALASLLPQKIPEFKEDIATWRKILKHQSRYWNSSSNYANEKLFQLIIESQNAFESALIQAQVEPSKWSFLKDQSNLKIAPFNKLQYKSGDIIAFNSFLEDDYYLTAFKNIPNAHMHLGCIYIKDETPSVIYIDHAKGISIVSIEKFIEEISPCGIILRLRDDIPDLFEKPTLPLLVSKNIYQMAKSGAYKYDYNFSMESQELIYDWELISKSFAKEGLIIGSKTFGKSSFVVNIGENISHFSSFEIEFDHRFIATGEWYNSFYLYKKRLFSAATASLIENKTQKDFINYLKLPLYRLTKLYSMVIDKIGLNPPIPYGISAQSKLVYNTFREKRGKLLQKLKLELKVYEQKHHHKATYLEMMHQANKIMTEQKENS